MHLEPGEGREDCCGDDVESEDAQHLRSGRADRGRKDSDED